jgi:hypothetical protein
MRALLFLLVASVAGLVLPGHAYAQTVPAPVPCGLPQAKPLWIDFGTPQLEQVFARSGLTLAVSTGDFPAEMRAAGARTVYWDMNLNGRVGTPTAPADPALIVERANRLFDFAAQQSGCPTPLIALNELFGAHLETPWTATNTVYRQNVMTLMRTIAERGGRPFLLLSSTPYTGSEEAVAWWREAATYGDLVLETYFGAPSVWAQGPIVGNRRLRTTMRRGLAGLLAIGIPKERLGLVLGFQTARGTGGREGLAPRERWFEYVKWNALAARQVAGELGISTIWSWGWATYGPAGQDADKPAAACVYLWTRNPRLCDGLAAAGPRFNASLADGQLRLPAGAQCTLAHGRIRQGDLNALQRLTGDRDVAFAALLARIAEARFAPIPRARVLAAEQAVIVQRFGGRRAAYTAAVRRAGADVTLARGAIADELRRAKLADGMRARRPSANEVSAFYFAYPELLARLVELDVPAGATTKPEGPWWLGGRTRGIALYTLAPDQVFRMPAGRVMRVRELDGTFPLRALSAAAPLGTLPLEQARPAISAALAAFERRAAFDRWSLARQTEALRTATCRSDALPTPGTLRLTSYLPFLSLTGS